MQQRSLRSFRSLALALKIALVAGALYVVVAMYATGQVILGTVTLAVVALATYVFGARRAYAARYLFPGLFGVALFIVLPLVYTVWIGLTKYSSDNLLTFDRATATLMSRSVRLGEDTAYLFTLHREGQSLRLVLQQEAEFEPEESSESEEAPEGSEDEGSIFDEEPDAGPVDAGAEAAGNADGGAPAAGDAGAPEPGSQAAAPAAPEAPAAKVHARYVTCLLYTSDAADE